MWKPVPLCFILMLLASCNEGNPTHEKSDSVKDTVAIIEVPQLDISGEFEAVFLHAQNDWTSENGEKVLTIHDLKGSDSLYIQYKTANPCEECRLETQIWKNEKYVDLVRDTGYGMGHTIIPASVLLNASKFGTPEYGRLSLYLAVRQYHPVETGNKRFLFYLELK